LANDYQPTLMRVYWAQLDTRFPQVEAVFEDCMLEALTLLTRPAGLDAYLEAASAIGKLGRGVEPMLAFMEEWPGAARSRGRGRAGIGHGGGSGDAKIAQRPRHHAFSGDPGTGGAAPEIAGAVAGLSGYHDWISWRAPLAPFTAITLLFPAPACRNFSPRRRICLVSSAWPA